MKRAPDSFEVVYRNLIVRVVPDDMHAMIRDSILLMRPIRTLGSLVQPSSSSRNFLAAASQVIGEGHDAGSKAEPIHKRQPEPRAIKGSKRAPGISLHHRLDTMHIPAAPLQIAGTKELLSIRPMNNMATMRHRLEGVILRQGACMVICNTGLAHPRYTCWYA